MKRLVDFALNNIPWIITILLAVGAFGATIKYQGERIADTDGRVAIAYEKIANIERALIRIEVIQLEIKTIRENDLREIRDDLKDIKKIVLRPIVGYNDKGYNDKGYNDKGYNDNVIMTPNDGRGTLITKNK